jgi:phage terminase large subunit-like protein
MTATILATSCLPRFGTLRNPDRPTLGKAVGAVSAKLGKPFMPWQQYVADVVMEIDAATGRLAYAEYGLTVPRQQGKSTFVNAKGTHRCSATKFFGPRQHVVYTAQTRLKAREKWEEDFLPDLEASAAYRGRFKAHKGNGNEHTRFANRSRFGLESSTEKAGHGPVIDEAFIDEAFAHQDFRLEQAFGPAMITRLNKMLGWISTAGWQDGSPYLEDKVDLGRLVALEGRQRGLAYFEWSAPDDADPGDPAVWRACMPALGHTITEDAIRAEYEKARDSGKLNDFRRAYLNQWVLKDDFSEAWDVIRRGEWSVLTDPASLPRGPVALAVEVSHDRKMAAVARAGLRADGRLHVEVCDHRPGTDWVPGRLAELKRSRPVAVVADPSSHAGSLVQDLKAAGIEVVKFTARDAAAACGQIYDLVQARGLAHCGQEMLNTALAGAITRSLGDAWAWDRKNPSVDISPLAAVTLAAWGFSQFGRGRVAPYDILRSVG